MHPKKAEYAKTIKKNKNQEYIILALYVFTTKLATKMTEAANLTQPFNPL